jgi:hypothetical protein
MIHVRVRHEDRSDPSLFLKSQRFGQSTRVKGYRPVEEKGSLAMPRGRPAVGSKYSDSHAGRLSPAQRAPKEKNWERARKSAPAVQQKVPLLSSADWPGPYSVPLCPG